MLIGILIPTIVKADKWPQPKVETYYSKNTEYKLIVTPKLVPHKYSRYSYKSRKHPKSKRFLFKKEELEQKITPCTAKLYKGGETEGILIWEKTLLNDICPVYAIVANDGSSVATLDNWGSMGHGINVFVIYNEKAYKSYELKEISPFPISDYTTSKLSIRWCKHREVIFIDNERIKIVFETKQNIQSSRVYNVKSLEFEDEIPNMQN